MKKDFLQSIKIIVLGLILVLGISLVSATWTPPPNNPPQENAEGPINEGSESQVKNGGLSVKTFSATRDADFLGDVTLDELKDQNASSENRPICLDSNNKVKVCN